MENEPIDMFSMHSGDDNQKIKGKEKVQRAHTHRNTKMHMPLVSRLESIMLQNFPIMLFVISQFFCLLCLFLCYSEMYYAFVLCVFLCA